MTPKKAARKFRLLLGTSVRFGLEHDCSSNVWSVCVHANEEPTWYKGAKSPSKALRLALRAIKKEAKEARTLEPEEAKTAPEQKSTKKKSEVNGSRATA